MVAEFMKFYHYKLDEVLNMYAISFYALLASMYQVKAMDNKELAYATAVAHAGGDSFAEYIKAMDKQAKGAEGLLKEVRLVRKLRRNKK